MPHEPRKFIDKEHAEMMVYALQEHFLRISSLLDIAGVPAVDRDIPPKKLIVEQRVKLLLNALEDALDGGKFYWEELEIPAQFDEYEDPQEVSEKIAKLYEVAV